MFVKRCIVLWSVGLLMTGLGCRDASNTSAEIQEEPKNKSGKAHGSEIPAEADSLVKTKAASIPSAEVKLEPSEPSKQDQKGPEVVKEAEEGKAEIDVAEAPEASIVEENSSENAQEEKPVVKVPDPTQIDDLKKKPRGPDGVKEDKKQAKFLPSFPPKHDKGHLPAGVGESILDPRIAPDADADFDAMRIPLGTSSDAGGSGLATIPSALSFHLGAEGPGNHQRVRAEATEPLEIISVQLMDETGTFKVQQPPKLPYLMALGEAVFITVGSKGGTGPEETTLRIETDKGVKKIPVRYAKSDP